MCDKKSLESFILLLVIFLTLKSIESSYYEGTVKSKDDCFCAELKDVDDCNCTIEAVDNLNRVLVYPLLNEIVRQNFFRFYRVNLRRKCPFWHPDYHCTLRDCHVEKCDASELPLALREEETRETESGNEMVDLQELRNEDKQADTQTDEKCKDVNLGKLDTTLSDESKRAFRRWSKHDYANELNFCEYDDDVSRENQYVDLLLNPERFTGYQGKSARRIWRSIYEENCFSDRSKGLPDATGTCLEERVFYRSISGLHASINLHLSYEYPLAQGFFIPDSHKQPPDSQLHASDKGQDVKFGKNVCEFVERFAPPYTRDGPRRLKNLYFVYLLELRAFAKVAPYLRKHLDTLIYTGHPSRDAETREQIRLFLRFTTDFKHHFDETRLFRHGDTESDRRKWEFRQHFRNISHIMDCVACEKCRLWGKLQIQGLGTALKVLFTDVPFDESETDGDSPSSESASQVNTHSHTTPVDGLPPLDANGKTALGENSDANGNGQCAPGQQACASPTYAGMYTQPVHSTRTQSYADRALHPVQFQLRRNEIVAMFNAFRQLSKALHVLDDFRRSYRSIDVNQHCPSLRVGVH